MKRLRYSWTIVIALIIAAAPASAAIIADGSFVQVRAQLDAGSGPASGSDTIVTDRNFADTGETNVVNGNFSASCRALFSITGGPDLRSISTQ